MSGRARVETGTVGDRASAGEIDQSVKRVWTLIGAMFANRWPSHAAERADGARATLWRAELQTLRPEEIDRGLMACRVLSARPDRWAPTPAEFRALAQGVPTWEQFLLDVRSNGFTSRFAALAWKLLGPGNGGEHRSYDRRSEYRNSDGAKREQLLRTGYNLALEQVASYGWPQETGSQAIGAPPTRPGDREAAEAATSGHREAARPCGDKGYAAALAAIGAVFADLGRSEGP